MTLMLLKVVKPLHVNIVCNEFRRQSTYQPVGEFYAGRAVMITGGTGFVGKVLLEKLLYHCNKIDKVYLLLRDNDKMNSTERLRAMLKLPLFQRLRDSQPDQFKKIIPVSGDITTPRLGVSSKQADAINNEVSVVFHSAASVKFKDTLSNLLLQNTKGTQCVVDFSMNIKNLEVFAHVSSAYSQSDTKFVEEKIYPPAVSLDQVYKVAAFQNPEAEDALLNGKSNTYTLTKALAEDLVVESHCKNNLPAFIIRPSIISPVYKDCLPGWIDSWFGATALITTVGKGLCHVIRGQGNNIVDLIPVDYVTSTMIVAAARYKRDSDTVPVYNVCSGSANPVTLNRLKEIIYEYVPQHKFNVLPVGVVITDNGFLLSVVKFLSESVPCFAIDLRERLLNRKPWYNKVLQRVEGQREVMDPFTSNSWIICSSNMEYLALSMSPEDGRRFQLDPKEIDWNEYISLYLKGISQFMLKKQEKY